MGGKHRYRVDFPQESVNGPDMRHVLKEWNALKEKLRGKFLFIFLDYDGTLAPIAPAPDMAVLPGGAREALKKLSGSPCCKVAVISGRSLEDVKNKLGLEKIIYSGNHGLEIEGPQLRYTAPVSAAYKKTLARIKDGLAKGILPFPGAFIEDKGLSLTLHFRMAGQKQVPGIKTAFHEAVILDLAANRVKIKAGKKVLEVRPVLEWDKGKVVLWLLSRQKFARGGAGVLPLYIGDDLTDEDAFKALRDSGVTIFVGKPGQTYASYYLRNTGEVRELLERIIKLQEETGRCPD